MPPSDQPASTSDQVRRGCATGGCLVLFFLAMPGIALGLADAAFRLLFGWVLLPARLAEALPPTGWWAAGAGVVLLGSGLLHLLCSRGWGRSRGQPWQIRWTMSIVGILMLGVLAGLAGAGSLFQVSDWVTADRHAHVHSPRVGFHESQALNILTTFDRAQQRFRADDLDGDGLFDYAGSLGMLMSYDLVDEWFHERIKGNPRYGYYIEVTTQPDGQGYGGTAFPVKPDVTGTRYFRLDATRGVQWSTAGPAGPYRLVPGQYRAIE